MRGRMPAAQTEPTDVHSDILDSPEAGAVVVRGGIVRVAGFVFGVLCSLGGVVLVTRYLGTDLYGRFQTVLNLLLVVQAVTDVGMATLGVREFAQRRGEGRVRFLRVLLGLRIVLTAAGTTVAVIIAAAAGYGPELVLGAVAGGLGLVLTVMQTTLAIPLSARLRIVTVTALDVGRQVGLAAVYALLVLGGAGVLAIRLCIPGSVTCITRGKLRLRLQPVDLCAIVDTSRRSGAAPAHDEEARPDRRATPEIPIFEADPVRLAQVLSNLLTNAAKYTDSPGRISLTARIENEQLRVCVKDNGIGLSPPRSRTSSRCSFTVQDSHARTEGGLGIGLALVKGLVDLHGGTIEVFSEGPGRGSEFVVVLPCRVSDAAHTRSAHSQGSAEHDARPQDPRSRRQPRCRERAGAAAAPPRDATFHVSLTTAMAPWQSHKSSSLTVRCSISACPISMATKWRDDCGRAPTGRRFGSSRSRAGDRTRTSAARTRQGSTIT